VAGPMVRIHLPPAGSLVRTAIEETIPLAERAIRLSPRDPKLDGFYFTIARVHLLQSRTDEGRDDIRDLRDPTAAAALVQWAFRRICGCKSRRVCDPRQPAASLLSVGSSAE
jgi:hypothetical protein